MRSPASMRWNSDDRFSLIRHSRLRSWCALRAGRAACVMTFAHPTRLPLRARLGKCRGLGVVPDPSIKRNKRILQGDVPSPVNPPPGCHFHTRCPYAVERCKVEEPALRRVKPGQLVACHLR
jgi:oligopeptide/dipeptide ABC transporter ATP-binding protein